MHIGFLTLESPYDTSRGGGIAAYLRAMIAGLVARGHRVTVIANARESGTATPHDAVNVINICLPNWHWYAGKLPLLGNALTLPLRQIEWSVTFARATRRLMDRDPIDVLESTEIGALMVARRPPAPLVIRMHGSDYVFRKYTGQPAHCGSRWNYRLEQWAYERAHVMTTPSRFHAAEVAAGLGCAAQRIHVVPNPIAADFLAEAMAAEVGAGCAGPGPHVLYTGRMAAVKGVEPLLQAARIVEKTDPAARFVLAGPWQMPGKPADSGLVHDDDDGAVRWLGHVPWQKLIDWYRRAAVFVMPSFYETFGISCLEAMAFGVPVVATTAGGLPEVVEDGVTGLLVPPGDARALADAIVRLLKDPHLRRRMGIAGRQRVLDQFTADRVVDQTLKIYERVTAARPAA